MSFDSINHLPPIARETARQSGSSLSMEIPIAWLQLKNEAGGESGGGAATTLTPEAARKRLWSAVLLAQLLSGCLAVTGISSAALAAAGIAIPASQSVLNYALLALTFGGARLLSGSGPLRRPWWNYALLALADVEANYMVVTAYQFTSLTSVTLLDCFTIPAVIALSALVLGARYRRTHYAAAALCVGGLAMLVLAENRSTTSGRAPLAGDLLVLVGAALYAVSNVTQELYLSGATASEVLGMVGAFGAPLAFCQAAIFERSEWADLVASGGARIAATGGALAAFTVALFAFSALVPVVLVRGGAAALNLSLLTSDLWAAAARVAFFGGFGGGGGWFAASLLLVAAGLCLYASAGSPKAPAAVFDARGGVAFSPVPTTEELAGRVGSGGGGGGGGGGVGLPPPPLQQQQQHLAHLQHHHAYQQPQQQQQQQQQYHYPQQRHLHHSHHHVEVSPAAAAASPPVCV